MEALDFFREFSKSLEIQTDESLTDLPQTYRSYNNSLQNILRPIYRKLSQLEDEIREQGKCEIAELDLPKSQRKVPKRKFSISYW